MTFFRQTEKVLYRLRLKGDPFTLDEIAELRRISRAGASQLARWLTAAELLERLPRRGGRLSGVRGGCIGTYTSTEIRVPCRGEAQGLAGRPPREVWSINLRELL